MDRNIFDLNRISQVLRHAAWFITLIEDLVGDILQRHAHAEVLFVHGWNVVQPRCDIGIGGSFADEDDAREHGGALTAAPAYVATRLAAFRRSCEAAGIRVTYGERYPASHHNNLVQLFRHDAGTPRAGARLAAWAAEGRVHGVQLELGVPLRWPGAMRERFLTAAARAFGSSDAPTLEAPPPRPTAPSQHSAEEPAALEFYDPGCGVGFSSSIGTVRGRSLVTARVLVLTGRRRAALFVGENPQPGAFTRDGPRFEHGEAGLRLQFDGHLLELEDASEYVRLEDAFAASTLLPFHVDLTFHITTRGGHGRVAGSIRSAARCWRIDCHGFARSTALERPFDLEDAYTSLSASFGSSLALRARSAGPGRVLRLRSQEEETLALSALEVDLEPDRLTPRRFSVTFGEREMLSAEPLSRLAIVRPLARGGQARTTIGAARFRSAADGRGFGFYEYSIPIVRAGAADGQTCAKLPSG